MKRWLFILAIILFMLILFALVISGLPAFGAVTWCSYQDEARTQPCDLFTVKGSSVYMKADGLPSAAKTYQAKYYDATGQILLSYSGQSSSGVFLSEIRPSDFPASKPGTWKAELYKTEPSVVLLATDTFKVDQSAIPEFPTVAAGIGVAGLCFGFYYWRRRAWIA